MEEEYGETGLALSRASGASTLQCLAGPVWAETWQKVKHWGSLDQWSAGEHYHIPRGVVCCVHCLLRDLGIHCKDLRVSVCHISLAVLNAIFSQSLTI